MTVARFSAQYRSLLPAGLNLAEHRAATPPAPDLRSNTARHAPTAFQLQQVARAAGHTSRRWQHTPPRPGLQAAILVYLTDVVDARQIEVQAHDATLSRDPVSDVAITTAMFLPGALALAVLTFVVSEFGLKRWTGASRSQKVANVLQACAHLVAAFAYQVSIQQMSAVLVRAPRLCPRAS